MEKGRLRTKLFGISLLLLCLLTGCAGSQKRTTESTPTPVEGTEGSTETIEGEAALSEQAARTYQFAQPKTGELCAEIIIRGYGTISVKLFPKDAPLAVENFRKLAEEGYFNEMKIDQLIPGYLVQAGDVQSDGGKSIYGGGFLNEISEALIPARGALCMANLGSDGTNLSSFFVVQTKAEVIAGLEEPLWNRYQMTLSEYLLKAYQTKLTEAQLSVYQTFGGAPWLYGHHTVFGQMYAGFEVLDALMEAKITSKFKPNPGIVVEQVRIFTKP